MNKRNLIIASVTFTLALGVGGFYLWSQKKADLTQNKAESQKSKVKSWGRRLMQRSRKIKQNLYKILKALLKITEKKLNWKKLIQPIGKLI